MSVTPKIPLMIDVSHWEPDIRWQELSPRPAIVITKASEGKSWTDPSFISHWNGSKSIGAHTGAYHFFHINDIEGQVQNYLAQMAKVGAFQWISGWTEKVSPILDMEYTPAATLPKNRRPKGYVEPLRGTALANQIHAWLVRAEALTGRRPEIYGRATGWAYTFDALGRPPSWAKYYRVWVAGYPDRPDEFDTLPDVYMPKGFERWIAWQYSEAGILKGVPYDGVDLNLINPAWLAELGVTDIPADIPPTTPPAGTYREGYLTALGDVVSAVERLGR